MMRTGKAYLFGVHSSPVASSPEVKESTGVQGGMRKVLLLLPLPACGGLELGDPGRESSRARLSTHAPHQVNGHNVPQLHGSPYGLGRVLGQVDEPIAEHHVLEGVLLRVGHHDARLVGADGVVDLGLQLPPQERVQTAIRVRREARPCGAGHEPRPRRAECRCCGRLCPETPLPRPASAPPAVEPARATKPPPAPPPPPPPPGAGSRAPNIDARPTVDGARRWSLIKYPVGCGADI